MKPIHFVKIMAFARDNNLTSNSFNAVVATIKDSARAKGVSVEEYLEDYQ